jgi:hypothetical protein
MAPRIRATVCTIPRRPTITLAVDRIAMSVMHVAAQMATRHQTTLTVAGSQVAAHMAVGGAMDCEVTVASDHVAAQVAIPIATIKVYQHMLISKQLAAQI